MLRHPSEAYATTAATTVVAATIDCDPSQSPSLSRRRHGVPTAEAFDIANDTMPRAVLPPPTSETVTTASESIPASLPDAPLPPRNRMRSSRTKWESLPEIGGGPRFTSEQLVSVRDVSNEANVVIEVKAKMDKGFHFGRESNHFCCFKRNLSEIVACYSATSTSPRQLNPRSSNDSDDIPALSQFQICVPTSTSTASSSSGHDAARSHWVNCSNMRLSVKCIASNGGNVPLIQRTPKRDRGPTLPVLPKPCLPNGSLVNVGDYGNVVVWERIQFSKATPAHFGPAGVRKRSKPMSTYTVVVELTVQRDVGTGSAGGTEDVVIAKATSDPFIVRSRSPGQYGATIAAAAGASYRSLSRTRSSSPLPIASPSRQHKAVKEGVNHASFGSGLGSNGSPAPELEQVKWNCIPASDSGYLQPEVDHLQHSDSSLHAIAGDFLAHGSRRSVSRSLSFKHTDQPPAPPSGMGSAFASSHSADTQQPRSSATYPPDPYGQLHMQRQTYPHAHHSSAHPAYPGPNYKPPLAPPGRLQHVHYYNDGRFSAPETHPPPHWPLSLLQSPHEHMPPHGPREVAQHGSPLYPTYRGSCLSYNDATTWGRHQPPSRHGYYSHSNGPYHHRQPPCPADHYSYTAHDMYPNVGHDGPLQEPAAQYGRFGAGAVSAPHSVYSFHGPDEVYFGEQMYGYGNGSDRPRRGESQREGMN